MPLQFELRNPESDTPGGFMGSFTIKEAPAFRTGTLRFTSQIHEPLPGLGTTMNSISSAVGIDVSKDRLDVKIPGAKWFHVENSRRGLGQLLAKLPREYPVCLESSGGYERLAVRTLREGGIQVKVLNPCRAKQFARSIGQRAKTDKLDAEFLGHAGQVLPCPIEKSAERQALCDLSRHIQRLKGILAGIRKQLKTPCLDASVKSSLLRQRDFLRGEIRTMEKAFAQAIEASRSAKDYHNVLSMFGAGPVTARIVVTELPDDLSGLSSQNVASYAGLAPMDNSSGRRIGHKYIGRGNVRLKSALYTPAIGALKRETWAREFYTRLRSKGKSHQTAMVAVMRRILIRIVAVLKRGTAWQAVPPRRT